MARAFSSLADLSEHDFERSSIEGRIATDIAEVLTNVIGTSERPFSIEARVEQGRARLTGRVDRNYQKIAAGHYAARVPGVVEVINCIEIAPARAPRLVTAPRRAPIAKLPQTSRTAPKAADDHPGIGGILRYRYRTRIILGTWHSSRRAAVDDALRAGLAVRAMRGPGGLRWTVPGVIEEAGTPLAACA